MFKFIALIGYLLMILVMFYYRTKNKELKSRNEELENELDEIEKMMIYYREKNK